ncbi:MAG: branched-chain amino acid transaminase [Ignavibacteria bacterium]|nr:branched-chain amino acid transaminase [Ignavibacteria bacterium]MBI3766431.1 branched-chain amino acid transaminase [Ignavibacteriales bacterium]
MAITPVEKIWMNGKLINWTDAKIHVLSHVVHYGSSWFEGIRCYKTLKGPAIFRLDKHLERLYDSVKIYHAEIPYSRKQLEEAVLETIGANKMSSCYIRPIVYRGYGDVGVNPLNNPVDVAIAVWEWGTYLGAEALSKGIDVCVSSWTRPAPNTLPTIAKAGGNYLNAQLIKIEAIKGGFTEGIALDVHGYVSEGSGENIFMVKNRDVYTPPFTSSILPGVTRSSVITLLKEMGYRVQEVPVAREMLTIADELFFTGTAAEITPIRSVDRLIIGEGVIGPITKEVQTRFFDVVKNGNDAHNWLKFVFND